MKEIWSENNDVGPLGGVNPIFNGRVYIEIRELRRTNTMNKREEIKKILKEHLQIVRSMDSMGHGRNLIDGDDRAANAILAKHNQWLEAALKQVLEGGK